MDVSPHLGISGHGELGRADRLLEGGREQIEVPEGGGRVPAVIAPGHPWHPRSRGVQARGPGQGDPQDWAEEVSH